MHRIGPDSFRSDKLNGWTYVLGTSVVIAAVAVLSSGERFRWLAFLALLLSWLANALLARRAGRMGAELNGIRQDYRQLADLPAQATWISDAQGRPLFFSEHLAEWTGLDVRSTRADWLDRVHPDDRRQVVDGWTHALTSGQPYDQEHRLRMRDGRFRWVRDRAFPQRDDRGTVVRWIGQVEDVHERRIGDEQLRQTASLLEMIGSSTDILIWAKDRDGRMLYVNRALERLAGVTLADVLGKGDREWNLNAAEVDSFIAADRRVLETGLPDDCEESFTSPSGSVRHYRTLRSPLRDGSGTVIGSVGVATDITEQRDAEERERLLTRELDHRAKNMLAVVQSIVALTRAGTVSDFKKAVESRIQALSRAHSMLAATRWEGADLHRIVAEELAPYMGGGQERIHLSGPPLLLHATTAQSLALVVHELATNAAKYGALSVEGGQLDVSWDVGDMTVAGAGLRLTWAERNGPPVPPRTDRSRVGFGTRLIRSSIERQLGGSFELEWAPDGLVGRLEFPLGRTPALPSPSDGPEGASATRDQHHVA